jgi:hypothetical protein
MAKYFAFCKIYLKKRKNEKTHRRGHNGSFCYQLLTKHVYLNVIINNFIAVLFYSTGSFYYQD